MYTQIYYISQFARFVRICDNIIFDNGKLLHQ